MLFIVLFIVIWSLLFYSYLTLIGAFDASRTIRHCQCHCDYMLKFPSICDVYLISLVCIAGLLQL